jgi:hypothetical protein
MKYFIIIGSFIIIVSSATFLVFNKNPNTPPEQNFSSSLGKDKLNNPASAGQLENIQLQLNELKEIISKQSLFIQKLKEDILVASVKIVILEKKLQDTIAIIQASLLDKTSLNTVGSSQQQEQKPVHLLDPLLNQVLSGELFSDPQFAKVFQEQVAEAVKNLQQKEREEQQKRFNEQLQQRLARRIEEFAKTLNLTEYQTQELSKSLTERGNKTIELFTKFRTQEISAEEFRTQRDTVRNETNEKIKSILLPDQYEQYLKAESNLSRELNGGPIRIEMRSTREGQQGQERTPR